ncbi:MAG: T9SS type A sorting domain-containing protein [Rhodothermaceae bacterium]|nr:T9SS type A sorting domain-containing protein [Rhodothermaceae bacterium]MYG45351.1 T9SS type A sorting domain-containing protein [Rhodothermaceae bacterium]
MSLIGRKFKVTVASIIVLGAWVQLSSSISLQAQVPKVTASAVVGEDGIVNEDSLKAFVTWATSEYEKIEDLDEGLETLADLYREGSDYNSGEIYLILLAAGEGLSPNGLITFHGKSPQLNNTFVLNETDGEGTEVIKEMLKATKEEAIKVEYCKYDDPMNPSDCTRMTSFAMRYKPPTLNYDLVVVGGYSQNLDRLCAPRDDIEYPEVSADEVVSRETLRQFVDGATKWLLDLYEKEGPFFALQLGCQFRIEVEDGGHFKDGSVLLYAITEQGNVMFHAGDPYREGRQVLGNPDLRGDSTFVKRIIEAAQAGGGFEDYYWDDPENPNDDEMGTLRTTYANAIKVPGVLAGNPDLIVAASFFPRVPKVTASAVVGADGTVNEDSLKAFVTWATSEYEKIEDLDEGLETLADLYREGSDYNSGEIYLILLAAGEGLSPNGLITFHGKSPQLNNTFVLNETDGEGTEVIKEMLKATNEEAIKVEYCKYDDPMNRSDCTRMTSFAMRYKPPTLNYELVVVGGYSQNLESLCTPREDLEYPEISAAEVMSRETLKMFVDGATEWVRNFYEQQGLIAAIQLGCQLRIKVEDGGHFIDGTVYLYMITEKGNVIFHATDPYREGRQVLGNPDLRGDSTFVQRIIKTAQAGGGFEDYYWNDPDNPNDDEEGSLRTTYANVIRVAGIFAGDPDLIVAGSFFPGTSTAVEDEIREIPSEFVLQGNYPNPFNPSTRILFDLPERAKVTLQVIDVLGRKVTELPVQQFEAGANLTIELNAAHLASGTYLYRMIAIGSQSRYEKTGIMTLVK